MKREKKERRQKVGKSESERRERETAVGGYMNVVRSIILSVPTNTD